jgi:hypothetical protein
MKRYIYIMLALVMGAAGCKMTDGYERNPIDVGVYIGQEVVQRYQSTMYYADKAIIADWYLSTEDEELCEKIGKYLSSFYYDNCDVELENDTVRIVYHYIYKPTNEEREVVLDQFTTDGKLLSEGGTWILQNYCTITSNGDGGYIVTDNDPSGSIECELQLTSIELDAESGISYDLEGYLNIFYHRSTADKDVYLSYETDITETLVRQNDSSSAIFKSGAIHAVCDDWRYDRHDEVEIIFTSSKRVRVIYLGEEGSINQ